MAQAELGHLMDQLGVEEALFAGLRLAGADLKRVDALLVEMFVIDPEAQGGIVVAARSARTANGTLDSMRNLRWCGYYP